VSTSEGKVERQRLEIIMSLRVVPKKRMEYKWSRNKGDMGIDRYERIYKKAWLVVNHEVCEVEYV
jgi:hypothetical protein